MSFTSLVAGGVVIKLADLPLLADDVRSSMMTDRRRRPTLSSGATASLRQEGDHHHTVCRFNDRGADAEWN
jgi:hypothetical protein